jgi:hypothetical protein
MSILIQETRSFKVYYGSVNATPRWGAWKHYQRVPRPPFGSRAKLSIACSISAEL